MPTKGRIRVQLSQPLPSPARLVPNPEPGSLLSAHDLDEIFTRVAKGELLADVCRDARLPNIDAVYQALIHDPECFERFMTAQRVRTLADIDRLQTIAEGQGRVLVSEEHSVDADTGTAITRQTFAQEDVQRSKLRVDTIKWRAERLFPMIYGNRVAHDHTVSGELAEMMAAASNRGHLLPRDLAND